MKLNTRDTVVAAALIGCGCSALVAAQDVTASGTPSTSANPPSAPAPGRHWHHARGSLLLGTLLRATRQLNLSAAQKQQIKTLLSDARGQSKAAATAPDLTVLGNPSNSGYGAAVAALQTQASNRIENESTLASEIYNKVLSSTQQQQLPGVLAEMQAKLQQHRAAWLQGRSGGSG